MTYYGLASSLTDTVSSFPKPLPMRDAPKNRPRMP